MRKALRVGVGKVVGRNKAMACLEAPLHLVEAIQRGLVAEDMRIGAAVIVPVASHRRDSDGWPAMMVGALVVAPDMLAGVPAVWATNEEGSPIHAVDGAAREYSTWAGTARGARDRIGGYPEAEEARRCLPENE
jgi:hypothetical protein